MLCLRYGIPDKCVSDLFKLKACRRGLEDSPIANFSLIEQKQLLNVLEISLFSHISTFPSLIEVIFVDLLRLCKKLFVIFQDSFMLIFD